MRKILTKEPAEPGSRRWYRDMRLINSPLWIMPPIPLLYGLVANRVGGSVVYELVVWSPWVVSSVAFLFITHALWRVEVNVAANKQRPFTKKDNDALRRACAASAGVWAVGIPLVMLRGTDITRAQQDQITSGAHVAIVVGMVTSLILGSMVRAHSKGIEGVEELEKGV